MTPGKQTLTETVYRSQRADGCVPTSASEAFATASAGAGSEVPFRREMGHSFGESFGGVRAHLGDSNTIAGLGARAAAQGESIAFESPTPDKRSSRMSYPRRQQRRGGASSPQGKSDVSNAGGRCGA
jgi:hypothetical protein